VAEQQVGPAASAGAGPDAVRPDACAGEYMCECDFNWRIMKNIFTECHIYDDKVNYKPFDFKQPEPLFEVQRKIIPNAM
jgi:hypothetical protein